VLTRNITMPCVATKVQGCFPRSATEFLRPLLDSGIQLSSYGSHGYETT
jgi:hypothetical protein